MGRSGGSGGGGRSGGSGGGFGGGRSGGFGGSMGGGRSGGRSGGFDGRSGGYGYGGYRPRHTGNHFFFFGSPRYHYGPVNGGTPPPPKKSGSGSTIATIIVIVMALLIVSACFIGESGFNSPAITASTVERTPLAKGAVNETAYYEDTLGWITSRTVLQAGLQEFYQKTGVQPFLYITDNIEGHHYPHREVVEAFAADLYDARFTDEAHLLLIFLEYDGEYLTYYLAGSQAKAVIDTEAGDILLNYLDRHYYEAGLSDEEYFSVSFRDAANRIMSVTTSPWIPVLIVIGVVVILLIGFFWWRKAKAQRNREAEETERILNTPLDSFGDTEAEERAKKYEEADKS